MSWYGVGQRHNIRHSNTRYKLGRAVSWPTTAIHWVAPLSRDHSASGPEGSLHRKVPYLLWPYLRDLRSLKKVERANHSVICCTLSSNDDRWIGHALASCRGFYIPALQCMACMIRRRRCNSSRTICRSYTCGANKSFSINLDVVGNAGDNCSALSYLKSLIEHLVHFKGPGLGPLKYGQKWCTEI